MGTCGSTCLNRPRHARPHLTAVLTLVFGVTCFAQEGHPLVGTWRGEWGPDKTERHDVTIVMEFDGKQVTGVINPGFESMKLQKVTLDVAARTVRFDSQARDASGRVVPVVIEASFDDLTYRHRSLAGRWTQGAIKGDFKIRLE